MIPPRLLILFCLFIFPVGTAQLGPTVAWNQSSLFHSALIGTTSSVEISFSTSKAFAHLNVSTVPELDPFVSISPSAFNNVEPGVAQTVTLIFSIPKDTAVQTFSGTIQIKDGNRTVSKPLPVVIQTRAATLTQIPREIALPSTDRVISLEGELLYVKDEIDIFAKPGTPDTTIKHLVSQIGGVFMGSIPESDIYQIQLGQEGFENLSAVIDVVSGDPNVSFGMHHIFFKADGIPLDPGSSSSYVLPMLSLPDAWDITIGKKTTDQGKEIGIGIIDSGLDFNHADLRDNLVGRPNTSGGSAVHGTAVTSIIGAKGNNGVGIAGVMWRGSLRFFSAGATSPDNAFSDVHLMNKVNEALASSPRVINLSLSYECPASGCDTNQTRVLIENNNYWKSVFDRPESKSVLWVCSAGNNGINHQFSAPARLAGIYSNVISVGAVNQQKQRAIFNNSASSNYGQTVTVSAPGISVPVLLVGGGFASTFGGTSASAPYVTGVAGLVYSVNPDLTAAVSKVIIRYSSDESGNVDPDGNKIFILNALRSVQTAQAAFRLPDGTNIISVDYPPSRLPDQFPSDLPLEEPGNLVTQNFVAAATDGRFQQSRVFRTTRNLVNVIDAYESYFQSHGWTVQRFSFPNLEGVFATKSPNFIPSFQVTANENTVTHLREVQMHLSARID